jgi:glutamate-1-semialdehyde 2,1-aminomutase
MAHIAPQGPVYQAGTLSGNPLAMAAGIATLKQLQKKGFYEKLEKKSVRLTAGLAQAAARAGIPAQVDHVGSMLGLFFCADPVRSFNDAKTCDLKRFAAFYQGMRAAGVYIAPSQFEALFLSAAHTDAHIDATVTAAEKVLGRIGTAS